MFQQAFDPLRAVFGAKIFQSVTKKANDPSFYEVVVSSQNSYAIRQFLEECNSPYIEVLDQRYITYENRHTKTLSEEKLKHVKEGANQRFDKYVKVIASQTEKARSL